MPREPIPAKGHAALQFGREDVQTATSGLPRREQHQARAPDMHLLFVVGEMFSRGQIPLDIV